jgi:hypothetical protein
MTEPQAPYLVFATVEAKDRLLNVMYSHRGAARAIKKYDLIDAVYGVNAASDKSVNSKYDRSLRELIEQTNHEGGMICSSPAAGYWWADSLDDGLPAAEALERRAVTQLTNARNLLKNIKAKYGGQMRLV